MRVLGAVQPLWADVSQEMSVQVGVFFRNAEIYVGGGLSGKGVQGQMCPYESVCVCESTHFLAHVFLW